MIVNKWAARKRHIAKTITWILKGFKKDRDYF